MTDEAKGEAMGRVIKIDEGRIRDHLGEMVRGTVEEALNALLDAEADRLCGAERYERTEGRKDTRAAAVIGELRALRLTRAAELIDACIGETLTYYAFPDSHWIKIRTNNPLQRIMKEIRRRTKVVGAFPDGQSCLNLAAARLRHIAGTQWSTRKYMNMAPLNAMQTSTHGAVARSNVRKILDTTILAAGRSSPSWLIKACLFVLFKRWPVMPQCGRRRDISRSMKACWSRLLSWRGF